MSMTDHLSIYHADGAVTEITPPHAMHIAEVVLADLADLQTLAKFIEPDTMELLEAARLRAASPDTTAVPAAAEPVGAAEPPTFPAIPVQPAPLTREERQDPRLVADYERRLHEYQTVSRIIAERDELAAMVGLLLQHLTETEYSTQTSETYGVGGRTNRERRITEARALLARIGGGNG